MRNERTDELGARLNNYWHSFDSKALNLPAKLAQFINGINKYVPPGTFVDSSLNHKCTETYFQLSGEGEIYHFYFDESSDAWYCKA